MGRPRKRRREEYDNMCNEKTIPAGVEAPIPKNGRDSFENQGSAELLSTNVQHLTHLARMDASLDANIELQPLQESVAGPILGLDAWGLAEDPNSHFPTLSDSSTQPQMPPAESTYDITNEFFTDEGLTGCPCLPDLYSTLASFQSMAPSSFPYSIGALRKATLLGHEVVRCHVCPRTYNTAIQNSMLLGTLLQMVTNEYAKLLKHIDERSATDERIPFRVGEPSSPFDSRHTGTSDCPMAVNIELTGEEWQMLARKAIKQEVLGQSNGNKSLIGLVDMMRHRQKDWHTLYGSDVHAIGHEHSTAPNVRTKATANDDMCVQIKFIDQVKCSLERLNL